MTNDADQDAHTIIQLIDTPNVRPKHFKGSLRKKLLLLHLWHKAEFLTDEQLKRAKRKLL